MTPDETIPIVLRRLLREANAAGCAPWPNGKAKLDNAGTTLGVCRTRGTKPG